MRGFRSPVVHLGAVLLLVSLAAQAGLAMPQHKETLARYYGDWLPTQLNSCATCHVVPMGVSDDELAEMIPEHNRFGVRLRELGEQLTQQGEPADIVTRLKQVADEDSDEDGVANELELLAGRFPGAVEDAPERERLAQFEALRTRFVARYQWRPLDPVTRPAIPSERVSSQWAENPIDAFVAVAHSARELTPRGVADRHAQLRRVYLDLIGLPPTREQLHAFSADESPDAYDRVIEDLLASPQYGERWGRHWMDIWRYSDWAGWNEQVRDSQPHIWRWRDWIVESLNADKPYDRMVQEMLAADELVPVDTDALRATGFLVRNYKRLSREQWMQDTVEHTAQAFLGLTLKCARCHDHMYDPLPQTDYYRFRAFFEPYDVRIERLPGNANREQWGLARVYDAQPDTETYLYHRGDDRDPDKQNAIAPGVPVAMRGPELHVEEVALPAAAYSPDQRPFVIEEELAARELAVETARNVLAPARQDVKDAHGHGRTGSTSADTGEGTSPEAAATERQLRRIEFDLPLAKAQLNAFQAVLAVEKLEKGTSQPGNLVWEAAAKKAHRAQRDAAMLSAKQASRVAQFELESLRLENETSPSDKSGAAIEEASKKLAEAEKKLAEQEQRQTAEVTTEFEPRNRDVFPGTSTGRRLALARWLSDPANPLFARVAVNHIWLRHFGQGLAGSPIDFGANAPPPSHPALLDWLAAEFISPSQVRRLRDGSMHWDTAGTARRCELPGSFSMKHVHRLIVTSRTYRLASTVANDAHAARAADAANRRADPENRYYWRAPSRRMEAELVRDSVLHVAGNLDLTRGDPEIDASQGLTSTRRSLYFRHAPEKQMMFLKLFDAAAPGECYQRKESIVPQQALALVNSEFTHRQARILARRFHDETGEADAEFIEAAFEQTLSRSPRPEEIAECRKFLRGQRELLQAAGAADSSDGANKTDSSHPASDPALRARESLVHVLLNHHEFVTIP